MEQVQETIQINEEATNVDTPELEAESVPMQQDVDVYRPDFSIAFGSSMKVSATSGTFDNIVDFIDISSLVLDTTDLHILEKQMKLRGIESEIPQIHNDPFELNIKTQTYIPLTQILK